MMTRSGIFLCTCDGKIDKGIDTNAVQAALCENAPECFVTKLAHACLPDGRAEMQRVIAEQELNQVVVAACPERFQGKQLRETCAAAGVHENHFALVDWREGCANVHRSDRAGATQCAIDLVEMGAVRAEYAQAIAPARAPIVPHVIVIGGGIAGMSAARALAQNNFSVTLIERASQLGGQLRNVSLNGSGETFEETKRTVMLSPHVALYLDAQVAAVHGSVGNYRVEIARANGSIELRAGALIVATGAQEFHDAHLYHHDGRKILTLREIEMQSSTMQDARAIVYLLCAGSRDKHIPYCSNVCCLGALHQALRLKREHPNARITILFRDLYLDGDTMNDELVLDARRAGIEFLRYAPNNAPRVGEDAVTVQDVLSGMTRRVEYDRVVLATPLVPQDDAEKLARQLDLTRDADGFFIEPHYRVRPERQIERGIFVCGSAHRPVNFDGAILQGQIAAARAMRFIRKQELVQDAARAYVQTDICTGCAQCVETCAFHAITMHAPHKDSEGGSVYLDHAYIDPFRCLACGNCVVACPSRAIDLPNARDAQIFAQIDAVLGEQKDRQVSLVFGCAWSGFAAMELAGARRMQYSAQVRVIDLPCSARLSPVHVLYALLNGAQNVLLALCPPDECHYGNGNRFAEMRIENLRAQLAARRIDPQRVRYVRLMGDDAPAWVNAVATLT